MTREEQIRKTNVEVLRLKEMGLDIREIALKTAIKKSYIVKVLRESQKFKDNYKRNNKNRRDKRKNINGLTKREQQKQDTIKAIKVLKNKGLKQIEIDNTLNINKATVSKYLKL